MKIPSGEKMLYACALVGLGYAFFLAMQDTDTRVQITDEAASTTVAYLAQDGEKISATTQNMDVIRIVKPEPVVGTAITKENILRSVNQIRYERKLPTLWQDSTLDLIAETKLSDELGRGYFSHVSPDGRTIYTFFRMYGYTFDYAGENLARNFNDITSLMEAWEGSVTHYDNIINPKYEETGIAVRDGYVVQVFGTRRK